MRRREDKAGPRFTEYFLDDVDIHYDGPALSTVFSAAIEAKISKKIFQLAYSRPCSSAREKWGRCLPVRGKCRRRGQGVAQGNDASSASAVGRPSMLVRGLRQRLSIPRRRKRP